MHELVLSAAKVFVNNLLDVIQEETNVDVCERIKKNYMKKIPKIQNDLLSVYGQSTALRSQQSGVIRKQKVE